MKQVTASMRQVNNFSTTAPVKEKSKSRPSSQSSTSTNQKDRSVRHSYYATQVQNMLIKCYNANDVQNGFGSFVQIYQK